MNFKQTILILMEPTIEQKIYELNSFFNYFYLNKENFSKNIQLQLNLLKPLLKFDKNLLSSIEKDKLIFVQNENISEIIKSGQQDNSTKKNIDMINIKKLDLLLSIAKRFNMDLKYNKDKMLTNFKSNEFEFEKDLKDVNFDLLLKSYDEKFGKLNERGLINNKGINPNFISSENLIKNKDMVIEQKKEIEEIAKKNKELDLIIFDLKKQLSNYKDLPTEINQMKNLVEIKKEEYKALLIDKKVNNL
jgi:hypothetical protein